MGCELMQEEQILRLSMGALAIILLCLLSILSVRPDKFEFLRTERNVFTMQTVSVSIHASMVVLASRSTSILADLLFVFARLIMKGLAVRSPLINPFICLVE